VVDIDSYRDHGLEVADDEADGLVRTEAAEAHDEDEGPHEAVPAALLNTDVGEFVEYVRPGSSQRIRSTELAPELIDRRAEPLQRTPFRRYSRR